MEKCIVICAVIFLCAVAAARADEVEVYDWSTGEYKECEVHRHGRNVEVYDWSEGRFRDYSLSNNGREIYDWQAGSLLDLKPRGCGRFEVYDWQEHTYYDVKVKHH